MVVSQTLRTMLSALAVLVALPVAAQAAPGMTSENQVALYLEQQETLATQGQELIAWFLAGNDEAFLDRSSNRVRESLASTTFEDMLDLLQTNRLSMDNPVTGGHFSGYFDRSQRIWGFYHDGSSHSFRLTTEQAQSGDVPTGRWTGIIAPEQIEISIDFSGSGDALTATLDMPSANVQSAPLTNVTFASEQPIGTVVNAQALPMSPTIRTYTEVREWGSGYLVFSLMLDKSGKVTRFRFSTPWQTPPDIDAREDERPYQLPADEQLIVYWGGQNELPSYHRDLPGWRYGYEFAVWRDGSTYVGDGASNEDYYIWGMPVVAPASGTIVAIENGMPDLPPGQALADPEAPELDAAQHAGNYVMIQTAANEWIVVAHLQQGSISLKVGDVVQVGDDLGRVGHSGTAPEPLLHLHAQASADLTGPAGTGLSILFSNVVVNGSVSADLASPHRGQFIDPST